MNENQIDTAILIQARLGSSRLPEKILKPINDVTMLESVFRRCQSTSIPTYIITTPTDKHRLSARVGMLGANVVSHILSAPLPEDDVLGRYRAIAEHLDLKHIIRVTADCPLVDPDLILELLTDYRIRGVEIAGVRIDNSEVSGVGCYPDGLDAEIFSIDLLRIVDRLLDNVRHPHDREHVTSWIWESEDFWATDQLHRKHPREDYSALKWSVDTESELEHVRTLVREAPNGRWMDYVRIEEKLREKER